MRLLFEELPAAQRAGGVEAATRGLTASLICNGQTVQRSSDASGPAEPALPDCVHLHGIWSPALAQRWQRWRARGVPCVTSCHGMLEPWALNHKRFKKRCAWHLYQRPILNRMDLLHATSPREAGHLRKLGLRAAVATIPWGLDLSVPAPYRRPRPEGDPSPQRTALFVGRIHPVKGLPMLVEAWAKVRPQGWKLRLVGPDEAGHQREIEAMVHAARLESDWEFVGPLAGDELQATYATAELFVMPSHTENFGMAIGEALSHELPVITTHGTPWQLLETERCGWWVPVTVDDITASLRAATNRRPEALYEMGIRGRQLVAERFGWDRIARQFTDCYRWLIGKGEMPECVEPGT